MPNAEGRMEEELRAALDLFSKSVAFGLLHPYPPEAAAWRTISAALAAARADVAAVEAACFEVCRDNTRETLGDDVDPTGGRFVCMNEDGDPIIEADTPADVVRQMAACWTALGERYDRLAAALAAARAENEKLREALAHYANAVNWMSHTDADAMLRVWIGSGDGPDYARRALAAQEGTR